MDTNKGQKIFSSIIAGTFLSLQVVNLVAPLAQTLMYAYDLHISYKTLKNRKIASNLR